MLTHHLRRRAARESGASAVEFALILPILIMLLFGITVFGINYNRSQGLQAAAREGARIGSLTQTTVEQIRQRVIDNMAFMLPAGTAPSSVPACPLASNAAPGSACVSVSVDGTAKTVTTDRPCNLAAGKKVQVVAQYRADVSVPLVPETWGSRTLQGSGSFLCES